VNNFYLKLAFVTGAGVAAQSVINSRLRLLLGGPIWAAAAQFIVGQLIAALVVDHYGLFGGTVVRLTPLRVTGVALLLGVVLIRWKSS
jgi:uncharacterized membrane protein YdcZ (DUF606 family)